MDFIFFFHMHFLVFFASVLELSEVKFSTELANALARCVIRELELTKVKRENTAILQALLSDLCFSCNPHAWVTEMW